MAAFTFLNTTGAPSLPPSAVKAARGHVTRSNFAQRRERKALEEAQRDSKPRQLAVLAVTQNPSLDSESASTALGSSPPPANVRDIDHLFAGFIVEIQSSFALAPCFWDVVILDLINETLDLSRRYSDGLMLQLCQDSDRDVALLASMCKELGMLRRAHDAHTQSGRPHSEIPRDLEERWMKLHIKASLIRGNAAPRRPCVRATAKMIEFNLYLATPYAEDWRLAQMADELRDELSQLPAESWSYMSFTSSHVFVGAMIAGRGSETRAWFLERLTKGTVAAQRGGLDRLFSSHRQMFASDPQTRQRLERLQIDVQRANPIEAG